MNKKIILSFLIIFLILTLFTFTCYATETENTEVVESDTTSDTTSSENNVTYRPQSSNVDSSYVTSVSPVSSQYEANLGLNNILSILLISIGILLILFSIAILKRIKK